MMRSALALFLAGMALASVANAARSPTLTERQQLVRALPASVRKAPVECAWLKIRVSDSRRYALVTPVYLNARNGPCVRYAADGFFILRKAAGRWRVVYVGSDPPPCAKHV